jgi:galactose mutarotase-like enzyme
MFTIENDFLAVQISPLGAELQTIYHTQLEQEYMWSGDPVFWGKHSPVLFPIVGTLKQDTYLFNEQPYHLPRHGFARDMIFSAKAQTGSSIELTIAHNTATLEKYPFAFHFSIVYALSNSSLQVSYRVQNTGDAPMYFSVGGHPAFKLPLVDGLAYEDYYLEFNHPENAGRWPISKDGLIEEAPQELLRQTNRLPLSKSLFQKDALVFKGLASNSVTLASGKNDRGLQFDFTGFPYLGIWAAKNADFICLEPWCGIADSVHSNQQLVSKEGIHLLQPSRNFERSWTVTLF